MHQLRYRHIFLKIIETDFVNSKTNSNKKGWMKNERKITTRKMIKMDHKILNDNGRYFTSKNWLAPNLA